MNVVDLLHPPPELRVLISAGAGGIGAGMARAFRDTGARVYVCDIDRVAVDRITGELPGIYASVADVADRAQVDRMASPFALRPPMVARFSRDVALAGGIDRRWCGVRVPCPAHSREAAASR